MKKLIGIVAIVALMATLAYAAFTENDYATMTSSISRLHAASEIRAEFKGFFADWQKRKARILQYNQALGSGDAVIPQAYIDEATAIYTSVNGGVSNLETTYKTFLTGVED